MVRTLLVTVLLRVGLRRIWAWLLCMGVSVRLRSETTMSRSCSIPMEVMSTRRSIRSLSRSLLCWTTRFLLVLLMLVICMWMLTIVLREGTFQRPLSNNVTGLFSQCLSNIGTPTSGTALTPTALGVTPFDCSEFCKLVKISKVRRYKIAPGDSISIQIRDPREYV